MTEARERRLFEAWAKDRYGYVPDRSWDSPEDYAAPNVNMAWVGWQVRARLDGKPKRTT